MLLTKLVSDYFLGNFRKIGKSTENIGKMIMDYFVKNIFLENCWQILGEYSEHFHVCHMVCHLLTGLLVWYVLFINRMQ